MHSTMQPHVVRLIKQFGQTVTLQRAADDGTYNPATGTATTTTTTITYRGMVQAYKDYQRDGTIIQVGDRRLVLDASCKTASQEPRVGDSVIVGGATYQILSVDNGSEGETTLIYGCQVRPN